MKILLVNCSPVKDGATAEIIKTAAGFLSNGNEVKSICVDDYRINFCKGCRSCHTTAECVQNDDVTAILAEFDQADIIICVSPSYWADIPGQFKAFIDRCTPWCNTHEPYAKLKSGKLGYVIALRTGSTMRECYKIIESIEHFYGHLEIKSMGSLGLASVEYKEVVTTRTDEIKAFCDTILNGNTVEDQPIFKAKLFNELTAGEIYEILKARSKIFQFEQNIKYLDEDDVDYKSLHCFFEENGQVTAYLRAYSEGNNGENIKLGRVLTLIHGKGDGKRLMELSIEAVQKRLGPKKIIIDAQKHAEEFYKKLGFVTVSGEFLEENIVHVKMELKNS